MLMPRTANGGSPVVRLRRWRCPFLMLLLLAAVAAPAVASRPAEVIVLPGATSAVAGGFTGQGYVYDTHIGASVPKVDGIVLAGRRLWAVQNFSNQVLRIRLRPDLASGVVEELIGQMLVAGLCRRSRRPPRCRPYASVAATAPAA
jgi:hypothetical protein